jgi:uncharacterized integral membrane protein
LTLLRQLLLIPLLAPLLAVLLVGAINPRPAVSLRLLIWTSPTLPAGVWMMLAATGGGLLSALGTGVALRAGSPGSLQRQVRRPARENREPAAEAAAPHRRAATAASAGPSRAAGEPSPTVEVPYRVIRRGRPAPAPAGSAEADAGAAAVGDGWDQASGDDW